MTNLALFIRFALFSAFAISCSTPVENIAHKPSPPIQLAPTQIVEPAKENTDKIEFKKEYLSSSESLNRLKEVKNRRSFDYEIALSEAVTDVKHVTIEALNQGNTYMALYHVNEGVKIAPFRGDLLDLKKKTINEYISVTNQYSGSDNVDCQLLEKRYVLLQKIAPDFTMQLRKPKSVCPRGLNLNLKAEELSYEDLVEANSSMLSGEKSRYLNFITYEFPFRELFIESIKRLKDIRFESVFSDITLDRKENILKVGGEIKTTSWINSTNSSESFCESVSKLLKYEGENHKQMDCDNIKFHTTPKAKYDLENAEKFNNYMPLNLVFKTIFYSKNGKTETLYFNQNLNPRPMLGMGNNYISLDDFLFSQINGSDKERLVVNVNFNHYSKNSFWRRPDSRSGPSYLTLGKVGSINKVTMTIPISKKSSAANAVGFSIELDAAKTLELSLLTYKGGDGDPYKNNGLYRFKEDTNTVRNFISKLNE
ncbi:MAG: hypothetical protein V4598_05725 [Bdellovibrionota bacterium]